MDFAEKKLLSDEICGAFEVLGHHIGWLWTEEPQWNAHSIEVHFHELGSDRVANIRQMVSDETLVRVYDVDEAIEHIVGVALRTLVPQRLMEDMQRVRHAMRSGPLGCEVFGGIFDGRVFELGGRDAHGWPQPRVMFPVPREQTYFEPVTPLSVLKPRAEDAIELQRTWVNPRTCRWVYRER